jgi:hypothetical protein
MEGRSAVEAAAVRQDWRRSRPFFLVGYARSGTTILRLMLNRHPDLHIPRESEVFQFLPPRLGAGVDTPDRARAILDGLPASLASVFDLAGFRAALPAQTPVSPAEFFALLHHCAAVAAGKPAARWGHKKPSEWQLLYAFKKWYPDAQFIHIVRNPLDVISSLRYYYYENRDVTLQKFPPVHFLSAWHWRRAQRSIERQIGDFGPDRMVRLRYEDFVADPRAALSAVCRMLNVDEGPTERMLAYREDEANPAVYERGRHMDQTRRDLNTASIGRAAANLTPAMIGDIAHICRREMAALGYAPPAVAHRPGPLRRAALALACIGFEVAWAGLRAVRRMRGRL